MRTLAVVALFLQSTPVEPPRDPLRLPIDSTYVSTFETERPESCKPPLLPKGAIDSETRNALYGGLAQYIRRCGESAETLLASLPCDGNAFQVLVAAATQDTKMHPEPLLNRTLLGLEQEDETCLQAVVPAMQHVVNPTPALLDKALQTANKPNSNAHQAGWLLVGSLAHTFHAQGDEASAQRAEAALVAAFHKESRTEQQRVLIEAAGNVGSERVFPILHHALRSSDPWMRRSGVAGLRFSHRHSVLCERLRKDAAVTVREHAAWALGFGEQDQDKRLRCLETAERLDGDASVRAAARQAMEQLKQQHKNVGTETFETELGRTSEFIQ